MILMLILVCKMVLGVFVVLWFVGVVDVVDVVEVCVMILGGLMVVYKVLVFEFEKVIGNKVLMEYGLFMGMIVNVILVWFECGELVDVLIMVGYVFNDFVGKGKVVVGS